MDHDVPPMRALVIGSEWFPNKAGGLNRYVHGEVHALPSVGVCGQVLLHGLRPGQSSPMALRSFAPEGASSSVRRAGVRRAVSDALQEGVDVVNAHFALYAKPWLDLLPRSTPFVVHFHGPWADEILAEGGGIKAQVRARIAHWMECDTYARADRLITLSEAFRQIAHSRYSVPLEKITVIPGGVDTQPYLAAPERRVARQRLGWPQDRPILFSVRRLARRMGLEGLIDAMEAVRKAHPDVLLFIGGTGAIRSELEARIQEKGLSDCVRLLGFVLDEDLPVAYAAADLQAVPTVALEGFGLITVEALASGTPVMGTPVGGTLEILRGLNPDLVFADTSAEAIATGLIAALSGSIALPDANACRAYAARYDWASVAPAIRAVFETAKL